MNKHYRHGDVLFIEVNEIPYDKEKWINRDSDIILEGEVTGHAHRISDRQKAQIIDIMEESFEKGLERRPEMDREKIKEGNMSYLIATAPTDIVHEEHKTITLPEGLYEIRRQREYDPERDRYVVD